MTDDFVITVGDARASSDFKAQQISQSTIGDIKAGGNISVIKMGVGIDCYIVSANMRW
jgi:hypothetical protein